jgi:hypothetical protein
MVEAGYPGISMVTAVTRLIRASLAMGRRRGGPAYENSRPRCVPADNFAIVTEASSADASGRHLPNDRKSAHRDRWLVGASR